MLTLMGHCRTKTSLPLYDIDVLCLVVANTQGASLHLVHCLPSLVVLLVLLPISFKFSLCVTTFLF